MGQQQLLLLILVFVIVAVATYLAIDVFSSASDASSIDSIKSDLSSIAASAQSYYYKPAMIGGGGRSFEEIDFTKFAFSIRVEESAPLEVDNENARYTISDRDNGEFVVTGTIRDQLNTAIAVRICPDTFRLGTPGEDGTAPDPPACTEPSP